MGELFRVESIGSARLTSRADQRLDGRNQGLAIGAAMSQLPPSEEMPLAAAIDVSLSDSQERLG